MAPEVEKSSDQKKKAFWPQLLISILMVIGLDLLTGLIIIPESFTSFRTPHYFYHHGLQSDQDTWAVWGSSLYPLKTNSLGLIDSANYDVEPLTSKTRILILGDSHSEGVGVPYEKTFSGILARNLREKAEILNASCISYSPKIEYLKARYLLAKGLKVSHIFVLIDISDMQNEMVYEKFEPKEASLINETWYSMRQFLRNHSSVFYLVNSIVTKRETNRFLEKARFFHEGGLRGTPANSLELYASFFRGFDDNVLLSNPQFHGVGEWYYNPGFKELADRGIQLGQENILKLKKLCDDNGIGLTISVHPWHYQVLKGVTRDYYVENWSDFADAHDIGFINLFPLFIGSENPVITTERYFIKDDNHWNEFGHSRVASELQSHFETLVRPATDPTL